MSEQELELPSSVVDEVFSSTATPLQTPLDLLHTTTEANENEDISNLLNNQNLNQVKLLIGSVTRSKQSNVFRHDLNDRYNRSCLMGALLMIHLMLSDSQSSGHRWFRPTH